MSPSALRRRVLLSGTMFMAAAVGYGRRAYAACVNSGGATYQCSGANVTQQTINANSAAVSTLPGFSVNTTDRTGITITGDGAISYTDTHASPITGYFAALYVRSTRAGLGSITINTNGAISGTYFGINARSYSRGAITITTNGNVGTTGVGAYSGIYARNDTVGTDISVTTGTGTTVSGRQYGIYARNHGTGAITITANGDVTGGGIRADNISGTSTSITVTTAAGTTVSGITARNYGTGATTVTANGDVIGSGITAFNLAGTNSSSVTVTTATGTTVSGGGNFGIWAGNYGHGVLTITANGDVSGNFGGIRANTGAGATGLTVTTAAGTTVSGSGSGTSGIYAKNGGTGVVSITANGDVTGTDSGIIAENFGAASILSVTTGASATVSGGRYGIYARNQGTGALTVTANGDVTGTSGAGISAVNFAAGTDLNVTTGAGTTVSGATRGIRAYNFSTGALTITANGNVIGTSGDGIFAHSGGGPLAITVAATGTVTGGAFAVETTGAAATVTVAGTVNGGAGGAINFDQASAFANRLELVTGAVINGNVFGGLGTDTLGLSGTGSGSFNVGQLSSFEAGDKTGSGTWTLTGANTGITAFSVGAGTLFVNGSLGNAAFAVSGGTLGGTGTVGNTQINAGGIFAPGSGTPGSSMTVNGTLGFNAAATYAVNINPTTSSFANVSGVATLGGATVNAIFASGSYISKQYTILNAASISGSFGTLANTNLPVNFTDTLSYDATHAYLDLSLSFQQQGGLNGNQQAVANALTNFFNTTGGIPGVFGTLTPTGLTQLAGETATGSQQTTFNAMTQFMNVMTDPFIAGRGDAASTSGGASGYADEAAQAYAAKRNPGDALAAIYSKAAPPAPFEARWSTWVAGYGGSQSTSGNAAVGSNNTTSSIAGTAVGADYRFSPFTIAGFSLAGGGTSFNVAGGGSGHSDLFQAGAFVRHTVGAAYITGALAYGWQDITTNRTVSVAGIDQLRAEFNANTYSGRIEGGYRFVSPWIGGIGITPYAAGQFTTFDLPAYAESVVSGAANFALAYGARDVTDSRSELGVRTDKSFAMQDAILTLRGRFAWAHDYDPSRSVGATFQALPGASFVVNGAAQASESALTTASAELKWTNNWSVAATFEGEFSNVTSSYAGKGVVRYVW
jgi:uncharacterized protein with beta-barrel porin domain